jgi:hypothetical protein
VPNRADREASQPLRDQATDLLLVLLAWIAVVVSASVLPVDDAGFGGTALFVHLVSLPIAFGAVVMVDVYLVLWLCGRRTVQDVLSLTGVAHRLMAVGLGGLIASGIALQPDLGEPLFQVKLVLVLAIMLSAVRLQHTTRMLEELRPTVRGDSVPWPVLRRVGTALLSQGAWWAVIVIGFLVNASRQD